MSSLPRVLSEADLPLPELGAACLDGEVFRVAFGRFACVDECEDPALRARALSGLIPRPAILAGVSALWVYGLRSRPPGRLALCIDVTHRARIAPDTRWVVSERRLMSDDVGEVGGVRVVTPICLACDLLRAPAFSAEHVGLTGRLLAVGGISDSALGRKLEAGSGLPGGRRALERYRAARPSLWPDRPVALCETEAQAQLEDTR